MAVGITVPLVAGPDALALGPVSVLGFVPDAAWFAPLVEWLIALSIAGMALANLLRSPTGRAFIAIRDSETAGKSMGIDLAAYKVKSFGISAAITGLAGVLFAHKMTFISPEMFTLLLSIEFIMVIIIGGALLLAVLWFLLTALEWWANRQPE